MHYLVAWNYFTFVTGQNVLHKIQHFFIFRSSLSTFLVHRYNKVYFLCYKLNKYVLILNSSWIYLFPNYLTWL